MGFNFRRIEVKKNILYIPTIIYHGCYHLVEILLTHYLTQTYKILCKINNNNKEIKISVIFEVLIVF